MKKVKEKIQKRMQYDARMVNAAFNKLSEEMYFGTNFQIELQYFSGLAKKIIKFCKHCKKVRCEKEEE